MSRSTGTGKGKPAHSLVMLLPDITLEGTDMDWIITPEQLSLPQEDGRVINNFHWVGHVKKSDGEAFFQGTLFGTVIRECVRCLQEYQDPMAISIQGTFQVEQKKRHGLSQRGRLGTPMTLDELDDDTYLCEGNRLAFAPIFREHVILSTPLQPLCAPECQGLCQDCGQNLNRQRCECAEKEAMSPHFTKLQQLASHLDLNQVHSAHRSKIVSR